MSSFQPPSGHATSPPKAANDPADEGMRGREAPLGFSYILDRVSRVITTAMAFLAAGGIALLMVVITVDVVGRATVGIPFVGSVEIATNLVVAIAFLGMPYALHRGSHIRSTVLLDRLPTAVQMWLTVIGHLVGMVAFTAVAWGTWSPAMQAWRAGEYEGAGALRVPTWPIRWLIIVVALVMILEGLNSLLTTLGERRQGEHA